MSEPAFQIGLTEAGVVPPLRRRFRMSPSWLAWAGLAMGILGPLLFWTMRERDPAALEARDWMKEFVALRQSGSPQRLPVRPLSSAGQQVLVDRLVQADSRVVGMLNSVWRRLPPSVRAWIPRPPRASDRVLWVGPALIELPGTSDLRRRLLEAALRPGAANTKIAAQIAGGTPPIQPELFPSLERLARHPDPQLRMHAAVMLQWIPVPDARVERLLGELRSDQVSVVREAAVRRRDPATDED